VKFQIAPVGAGGSMVFWSADPTKVDRQGVQDLAQSAIVNDSWLDGFTVGDSTTLSQVAGGTPALLITDVQQPIAVQSGATQGSHCIGCHVGTPDGDYVAFVDAWPWGGGFAGVKDTNKGQALTGYPGATCPDANHCAGGARSYVQYPWMGGFAFSAAHWAAGDRIGIVAAQLAPGDLFQPWSTDNKLVGNLVWIDTESTATTTNNGQIWPMRTMAFDYMKHTGDRGGVAFPTWSNDGNTIVYASSTGTTADQDGRLNLGATDLYAVPYNARAGGAATAVPGASDPGFEEYYPAFSPDDKMIAFTRVPVGQVMYANANAEVLVVPYGSSGAQAIPLAANKPVSCSGKSSPGINNHWARWSPDVGQANGKLYYWLIFSSNRYGLPPATSPYSNPPRPIQLSQLYMTAVVVNETSTSTYPAVYLWNQRQDRMNTTPAWQNFNIPLIVQ
jgi:hypothetical protein